ncbi:MAG: serine/threonine protein kinase [Polyangiaceae bacterium]|jgi:serine/threonine protein kinase|nr:serine/threonine protein kinase [Polyangiaceae bacterium]
MAAYWPDRSGTILEHKYRLERRLGAGGMGEVYLASHLQLGHVVAIKTLLARGPQQQELHERFRREAMAAATLRSDHIAQVFDVGWTPDGAPFMVMEYLAGVDLAVWLQQRGPVPVAEVIELLRQACAGVAVAHAAGIVHRDLKPANLFLLQRPAAPPLLKILDFGVAKIPVASAHRTQIGGPPSSQTGGLTTMEGTLGSVRYMAPEQMESARDVSFSADLWSLGVIAYRMLTGRFPFEAESFEEQFHAAVTTRPVPVQNFRTDVPPRLAALVEGCLQVNPLHRWPSAWAMHQELAALQAPPPAPKQRPWFLLTGLAAGLVLGPALLGALWFWMASRAVSAGQPGLGLAKAEALPTRDLRNADLTRELLPEAERRARKLDPQAVLHSITTSINNGRLDLSRSASYVTFNFLSQNPDSDISVVMMGNHGVMASRGAKLESRPAKLSPRCGLQEAWRVAQAAGAPLQKEYLVQLGIIGPQVWYFHNGGKHGYAVDSTTCTILKDLSPSSYR